jgi:hypothetical protein
MTDRELGALRRALHHAIEFLSGLESRPVGATALADELWARIDVGLGAKGIDPERVMTKNCPTTFTRTGFLSAPL